MPRETASPRYARSYHSENRSSYVSTGNQPPTRIEEAEQSNKQTCRLTKPECSRSSVTAGKQSQCSAEITELHISNQLFQERLDEECKKRVAAIGQEIKRAQEQRLKGHLGTLRVELKKAQDEIKQEVMKNVESEMAVLHNHVGLVPFSFTMPDFQQKKRSSSSWYSPSFYTHPRGYKMCIRVDANGNGDGMNNHVSVYIYMMRGEDDESLKWPFRANITIQLLSQVGGGGHHTKVIAITDRAHDDFCKKVVLGQLSPQGSGLHRFVCHSCLLPKYLKDNCLKLCIKEVELKTD